MALYNGVRTMFLLPAALVVAPLVVVVGVARWLRRHLEDGTPPRWARLLGVERPGLIRLLAVFDGLRVISLVAMWLIRRRYSDPLIR